MAGEDAPREPSTQLYPEVLAKVTTIFGVHLADVLTRHRRVESLTGEKNVIGRQNLVEALAHLGTLFARAPELDRDEQLEQVAYLGDHLRRVMMESFELEVYVTIGAIWDDESRKSVGRRYQARVAPLIKRGKLLGYVTPDEVEQRFDSITDDVVAARRSKVADEGWVAWTAAADDFEAAAQKLKQLRREMGAAVDAATSMRRDWLLLGISSVVSAVLGVGLGLLLAG